MKTPEQNLGGQVAPEAKWHKEYYDDSAKKVLEIFENEKQWDGKPLENNPSLGFTDHGVVMRNLLHGFRIDCPDRDNASIESVLKEKGKVIARAMELNEKFKDYMEMRISLAEEADKAAIARSEENPEIKKELGSDYEKDSAYTQGKLMREFITL